MNWLSWDRAKLCDYGPFKYPWWNLTRTFLMALCEDLLELNTMSYQLYAMSYFSFPASQPTTMSYELAPVVPYCVSPTPAMRARPALQPSRRGGRARRAGAVNKKIIRNRWPQLSRICFLTII